MQFDFITIWLYFITIWQYNICNVLRELFCEAAYVLLSDVWYPLILMHLWAHIKLIATLYAGETHWTFRAFTNNFDCQFVRIHAFNFVLCMCLNMMSG